MMTLLEKYLDFVFKSLRKPRADLTANAEQIKIFNICFQGSLTTEDEQNKNERLDVLISFFSPIAKFLNANEPSPLEWGQLKKEFNTAFDDIFEKIKNSNQGSFIDQHAIVHVCMREILCWDMYSQFNLQYMKCYLKFMLQVQNYFFSQSKPGKSPSRYLELASNGLITNTISFMNQIYKLDVFDESLYVSGLNALHVAKNTIEKTESFKCFLPEIYLQISLAHLIFEDYSKAHLNIKAAKANYTQFFLNQKNSIPASNVVFQPFNHCDYPLNTILNNTKNILLEKKLELEDVFTCRQFFSILNELICETIRFQKGTVDEIQTKIEFQNSDMETLKKEIEYFENIDAHKYANLMKKRMEKIHSTLIDPKLLIQIRKDLDDQLPALRNYQAIINEAFDFATNFYISSFYESITYTDTIRFLKKDNTIEVAFDSATQFPRELEKFLKLKKISLLKLESNQFSLEINFENMNTPFAQALIKKILKAQDKTFIPQQSNLSPTSEIVCSNIINSSCATIEHLKISSPIEFIHESKKQPKQKTRKPAKKINRTHTNYKKRRLTVEEKNNQVIIDKIKSTFPEACKIARLPNASADTYQYVALPNKKYLGLDQNQYNSVSLLWNYPETVCPRGKSGFKYYHGKKNTSSKNKALFLVGKIVGQNGNLRVMPTQVHSAQADEQYNLPAWDVTFYGKINHK